MRYCFILVLILLSENVLIGQSLTILDAINKEPLIGATVYIPTLKYGSTSDLDGKVILNNEKITPSDTFVFQYIGYEKQNLTLEQLAKVGYQALLKRSAKALDEVIISASRSAERIDEVTNKVSVLKPREIALSNSQTSADLLLNTGSVFIQKSQMGGGSPVIRGFEANKVLIVVDGVRLNNAIFRGGHLQNVITIDPSILERTEVVFGPGSLIYGSDALGGVMQFITKNPKLSVNNQLKLETNAYVRYATVNEEKTIHANVGLGGQKFGSLTSFTRSDYGDLKIGKNRTHGYDNWGLRPEYVGENDAIITNDDPNILRFTGYDQINILQKFHWKPNNRIRLTLSGEHTTSSDIPRYDRLNDYTSNAEGERVLRYAEWHYGPQKRSMIALNSLIMSKSKLFEGVNIVAAWQKIQESRINRSFDKETGAFNQSRNHRIEDVQVLSLNADFSKTFSPMHRLQYGVEVSYNDVKSNAFREDVATGEVLSKPLSTRYPDDGSQLYTSAVYLRHKWKVNERLILTDGLRYSLVGVKALYDDTTFYDLPFKEVNNLSTALTAGVGLVYKLDNRSRINFSLSTGFRAPNVDDITKVFEPDDGIVVVPNKDLKPEYAYSVDFGLEKGIGKVLQLTGSAYATYLTNAIVRRPFNINGVQVLEYDGAIDSINTNMNAGEAIVWGAFIGAKLSLKDRWTVEKRFNFVKGRDLTEDVNLGHIPPSFGDFTVSYDHEPVTTSFFVRYNLWKRIEDYSPYSEDKASEATEDGTPAWYTLNWRMSYSITPSIHVIGGIENILDHHYKPFASGLSGAGRNFILTLRWGKH